MGTGTTPLFAIGPIQAHYAGTDTANSNWLKERWIMFNGPDQPRLDSFSSKKSSPLDKTTMPAEDSDQVIAMDLDGVERSFTLSGTFSGTRDQINTFIGKVELLLNGAQIDEDALRLIQRNTNQVPARISWSTSTHAWSFGTPKGSVYPPDWSGDSSFGLNIGIVLESFDWDYTSEACDEISFTLTFIEGVTY